MCLVITLHFCLYNKKPDCMWIIFIGCNGFLLISAAIFSKRNAKFSWHGWTKWITATPEGADLISPFSFSTSVFFCPDSFPHFISIPTHKHNSLLFLFKITPSVGKKTPKPKYGNPTYFVSLSFSIILVNWIHWNSWLSLHASGQRAQLAQAKRQAWVSTHGEGVQAFSFSCSKTVIWLILLNKAIPWKLHPSNIFSHQQSQFKEFWFFPVPLPVPALHRVSSTTFLAALIQLFVGMCCKPDHWDDQKSLFKSSSLKKQIPLILQVVVIRAQPEAVQSSPTALSVSRAGRHWAAAVSQGSLQRREPNVRGQGSDKLFYTALPLEKRNVEVTWI